MNDLRLKWNGWYARAGNGLVLQIFDGENGGGWVVVVGGTQVRRGDNPPSELAAKLAAEAAAFEWLRQGIESFGGQVVTPIVMSSDDGLDAARRFMAKEREEWAQLVTGPCGWPVDRNGPCPHCAKDVGIYPPVTGSP
jgi:hypothetical protein